MNKIKLLGCLLCSIWVICAWELNAQSDSQIKVSQIPYKTYDFSDPDPVPVFGKIYPYYRYDGFTNQSKEKTWTVVELENDYLSLKIFPEIGGKIWSVVDKTTGKELFYGNTTVKFRDIAMRGPWTAGGIEFNYGIIGHAPSCSFPVNYLTRKNADGSASCFISDFDLLTRTIWTVEINLPRDKGWFTTRSFWHNKNSGTQPYYNWVNTGILRRNDLQFIHSGTHYIGHDGDAHEWPVDRSRNKNLSLEADNDFGKDKSYHILGTRTPYFGAFWASDDFGLMQYTNRDEKPGQKIFLWAASMEGEIWTDLLADQGEAYVEIQSGRLFNQNMPHSSLTPFKQPGFMPYASDVWTEYWFPFKQTKGAGKVSLKGVCNVKQDGENLSIYISPLQKVNDTLKVLNKNGEVLFQETVSLDIAKPFSLTKKISGIDTLASIYLGCTEIWNRQDNTLQRPVETEASFDWNTAYGHYLRGRDFSGFRRYGEAWEHISKSLKKDPNFIPSLVETARLQYFRMQYDSAFFYARKALSIDTYNPEANYEYGHSALKLNQENDALDGFEIAAMAPSYRSAASTEISKIYLRRKNYLQALEYAEKSMINNQYNIEGLQLMYLLHGILQSGDRQESVRIQILNLDPLNHFVRFEAYTKNQNEKSKADFQDLIRGEMPEQIYLELAIWYYSLCLKERSIALLEIAPDNPECKYWQAFLHKDSGKKPQLLPDAEKSSPYLIFPFREESLEVFQWADKLSKDWKASYYMALIYLSHDNRGKGKDLLTSVGNNTGFAPLYALRAQVSGTNEVEDIQKAISLNPSEWRYIHQLTEVYMQSGNYEMALKTIAPFYKRNKSHYLSGIIYAKVLIFNKDYQSAESVLKDIQILPFEGSQIGRKLYQKTKLMLAIKALKKGNAKMALKKAKEAGLWPLNLGVGKPYDEWIDTRMEDSVYTLIRRYESKDTMGNYTSLLNETERNIEQMKLTEENEE